MEVMNVVQTIVVILLILAGGVLVETNMNVLGAPITLGLPNSASVTATIAEIVLAALAALVIAWLAGQVDRAILKWQFRRRAAVRVTSIALVAAAVPGRSRWRRRIPAGLLAAGLAVLAIGAARPQATVPVASSNATIMLALDVSGSMCSTDVKGEHDRRRRRRDGYGCLRAGRADREHGKTERQ